MNPSVVIGVLTGIAFSGLFITHDERGACWEVLLVVILAGVYDVIAWALRKP